MKKQSLSRSNYASTRSEKTGFIIRGVKSQVAQDRQKHYKTVPAPKKDKPKEKSASVDSVASREEYIKRFNEGKVSFNLPAKYPAHFACHDSYVDRKTKKTMQLFHQNKVYALLQAVDRPLKVLGKLNGLFYKIFTEASVNQKVLASNQELFINLSGPQLGLARDQEKPMFGKTYHINLRVRHQDKPNDPSLLMNFTTALTIMIHELAHVRHQNHGKKFMLLTKKLFCQALKMKMYPDNEEPHMYPSPRDWERAMYESRGKISDSELIALFDAQKPSAVHGTRRASP